MYGTRTFLSLWLHVPQHFLVLDHHSSQGSPLNLEASFQFIWLSAIWYTFVDHMTSFKMVVEMSWNFAAFRVLMSSVTYSLKYFSQALCLCVWWITCYFLWYVEQKCFVWRKDIDKNSIFQLPSINHINSFNGIGQRVTVMTFLSLAFLYKRHQSTLNWVAFGELYFFQYYVHQVPSPISLIFVLLMSRAGQK